MPIKKSELYFSRWASCDKLRGGMDASQSALAALQALPVEVLEADWDAVMGAAHFKAYNPISFTDAFAAQAALAHQAVLVTGAPEFRALEGSLKIEWLDA